MNNFPDPRETRSAADREAELFARLGKQIAHAQSATVAFASALAGVDANAITSRAALAKLPVIRKNELLELQQASRAAKGDPFGGFSALGWGAHTQKAARVFASPGPIYEPEGHASTSYARTARALYAPGVM